MSIRVDAPRGGCARLSVQAVFGEQKHMIAAVFAALFSGVTPVVAGRAIKLIGFVRANVIRLSFAIVILGVWAFAFGQGLRGQTLLFVSAGAIGFGLGGLSLLAALPRLGAPLASPWSRRPSRRRSPQSWPG